MLTKPQNRNGEHIWLLFEGLEGSMNVLSRCESILSVWYIFFCMNQRILWPDSGTKRKGWDLTKIQYQLGPINIHANCDFKYSKQLCTLGSTNSVLYNPTGDSLWNWLTLTHTSSRTAEESYPNRHFLKIWVMCMTSSHWHKLILYCIIFFSK